MITLIKDSIEYSLDDGSIAYYLGDQGWGMMPIHRLTEHGPLQDGDTDRGYRAEARIGKLLFELVAPTRYELFLMHEQLMRLFHPKKNLQLKWTVVPEGLYGENDPYERQFDVVFADDMDFPSSTKKGFAQKVTVILKASDPTCYDPNRELVEFGGGGSSGMVVPIHLGDASGLFFGMSAFNITLPVDNLGNADEYPEITIVGPITNLVITNVTYNEKLDFTSTTINAGETWVIDLRYGYKTVIMLPATNKLDKLSDDSDLATWRLRDGPNDIKVTGTAITSATKVQIRYYHRYTGV